MGFVYFKWIRVILFFFSSRRRHTRCGRDWSSDVCSSDLRYSLSPKRNPMVFPFAFRRRTGVSAPKRRFSSVARTVLLLLLTAPVSAAIYSVPGLSDTAVVTGLIAPTDFAFLPDGRMLILEKAGRVIIAGGGLAQPLVALDIQGAVDDFSERGLLGICLHPAFATNGYVFFYYTANGPKNRISRFTLTGNTI